MTSLEKDISFYFISMLKQKLSPTCGMTDTVEKKVNSRIQKKNTNFTSTKNRNFHFLCGAMASIC